jgi:molybdate transport system ATP-binding protein
MPDPLELDVRLRHGELALEVALAVPAGQTLALVGPSGAGKSTTLSVVAGLLAAHGRVTCGAAWLDSSRGICLPPEGRRVGLLFQDFALFPHQDVLGNVGFGARARRLPDAERRAGAWIERLGLRGLERRPVDSLSGGERQRVALARAMASDPACLLLDEPFGALDVATRAHVRSELSAFLRALPVPTVLVTHDPVEALVFGDRIAVIEGGRLSQVGTRDELRLRPRTGFAAQLTGLNLFPVELPAGTGLKAVSAGRARLHVLADELAGPAYVAFGAADVTLSTEPRPGSAQNVLSGTVVALLPQADRVRVLVDVGTVLAAEVTFEAVRTLGLVPGRAAWAAVKASAIRVYD